MKDKKRKVKVEEAELNPESKADPSGSYTGKPHWGGEPEQDADDL